MPKELELQDYTEDGQILNNLTAPTSLLNAEVISQENIESSSSVLQNFKNQNILDVQKDTDETPASAISPSVNVKKDVSLGTSVQNVSTRKAFIAGATISDRDAVAVGIHSMDFELGSTQFLDRADTASLSITGDMAIELWLKMETDIAATTHDLVRKFTTAGNARSYMFRLNNDTIEFFTSSLGTAASTSSVNVAWNPDPAIGRWYHLALVYDASAGTADFYVNGILQGTQQSGLQTSIFDSAARFNLAGAGDHLDGKLDEVRLWNTTRTQQQIQENMNIEIDAASSGLVGYWRLNNSLLDETSNGNDLSNNNAAVFSNDTPFTGQYRRIVQADASVALTADSFLGFASKSTINDLDFEVIAGGLLGGFSDIVVGGQYYLSDTAGQISTTPGSVSRKVAIGFSKTEILITNNW